MKERVETEPKRRDAPPQQEELPKTQSKVTSDVVSVEKTKSGSTFVPDVFADLHESTDNLTPRRAKAENEATQEEGPQIEEPPSQEYPRPTLDVKAIATETFEAEAADEANEGNPQQAAPAHDATEVQEGLFGLVELLLKDRGQLYQRLQDRERLSRVLPGLLMIALCTSGIVGAILGTYTGGWQILYVGLKLPLLLLLTLIVCYSGFWVWGLYFRTQIKAEQVAALTLASIATTGLLLMGVSPFLWLALGGGISEMKVQQLSLSGQETQYHRAILALVCCFGVAAVGGIRVLYRGILAVAKPVEEPRLGGTKLLATVWIGLYGFVGLQMAWILRPYLFHPWAKGRPLTFIRSLDGNVYESVVKTLLSVLGLGA